MNQSPYQLGCSWGTFTYDVQTSHHPLASSREKPLTCDNRRIFSGKKDKGSTP